MHSHLFAAARGLLASGEQVIDVTLKFTFLRGEGWRAASGGVTHLFAIVGTSALVVTHDDRASEARL